MSHLLDHYPFLYLIMNKLKLPWKLKTHPNLFSTELIYLGTVKSRVLTRVTNSKNIFGQRSQYISIEIPLHYQSEKDCMCFKTRWASTRIYTVFGSLHQGLSYTITDRPHGISKYKIKLTHILRKKCMKIVTLLLQE